MADGGTTIRRLDIQTEAARSLIATIRDVILDDEEARADAIEGETNLYEAIDLGVARLAEIEGFSEGLSAARKKLAQRQERLDAQYEKVRAAILLGVTAIGKRKIERATATLSIVAGKPKVVVTSEVDLPAKYLVEKVTVRPDLKAIGEDLKSGLAIPGAEMVVGDETLMIRTV